MSSIEYKVIDNVSSFSSGASDPNNSIHRTALASRATESASAPIGSASYIDAITNAQQRYPDSDDEPIDINDKIRIFESSSSRGASGIGTKIARSDECIIVAPDINKIDIEKAWELKVTDIIPYMKIISLAYGNCNIQYELDTNANDEVYVSYFTDQSAVDKSAVKRVVFRSKITLPNELLSFVSEIRRKRQQRLDYYNLHSAE